MNTLRFMKKSLPLVKYLILALSLLGFVREAQATRLAAWDFTGAVAPATQAATIFDANLDSANTITRGSGAAASAGGVSFRTVGFKNDGISTANQDYFQVTLSAGTGKTLSLTSIDGVVTGTATFAASPGVTMQYAYSLDGTTYTLIGSPFVTIGTAQVCPQVVLSGVPALQNVADGTTIYLRFYASGQTATGGWGYFSSAAGVYGLDIGGTIGTAGGGGAGFIQVETQADGSGTVVPAQSVTSGNAITVYAISRDASSNFVANVAPDSWGLIGLTGGAASGDLVVSGDSKSAVFTGHKIGTAQIQVNASGLNSTPSGVISVTVGAATQVRVESAADGSGTVVSAQNIYIGHTLTAYAIRRDASTNFVDNAAATWSLTSITGGVVSGDLVASGDGKSAVLTGNNNGSAIVHAVISGVTSVDSGVLTVTTPVPAAVVISQVYGSGGNSGANYLNDYVELFNRTANPVDINGWSVQYASAAATSFGGSAATQIFFTNSLIIQPYSYCLIQGAFGATPGSAIAIPTPDASNTNLALAGTAGKVALANIGTALGTVSALPDARIVDLVAYGASSPAEGGASAPTLTSTTAAFRNSGGCTDTDNNSLDFTAATASPRNSATAQNICPANTPPTISAIANQSLATNGATGAISFNVNDAESGAASVGLSVTSSNPGLIPTNNIVFGGSGIVRTVTLTPLAGQGGSSTITVTATDPTSLSSSATFTLFVGDGPQLGVLFNENFNADPDGTVLSLAGDISGGIWHTHSGTTYQIITSNQAVQLSLNPTNSEDISAGLTSGVAVSTGATLYLGFTIHETLLPTIPGDYFMHLKDSTTSNFFCKIFAARTNAAAGKYRLGVSSKANNPPNAELPVDLDTNTTYTVVVRYKVATGAATLWVNPASVSDTSVTTTDANPSPGEVDAIALRQAGNTGLTNAAGSQVIDNIAISTSFADVAPPSLTEVKVSVNQVVLSWPTNLFSYVLETNKLITGAPWGTNSVVPTLVGSKNVVTNAITTNTVFYRLQGQ